MIYVRGVCIRLLILGKGKVLSMVTFGRDLIAEKNKRENIKSSVIKYWNVNYFDPIAEQRLKDEENLKRAHVIIDRLDMEAAEDEAKKRAEIDHAYIEAELNDLVREVNKDYNSTTGSFSGTYGQGKVDTVTKDQVAMILNEKNAVLQGIIDSGRPD
ncbi:MAG: hypothetical protein IKW08_09430 [Roseburia sp.]|nr:hypothetical protein [Roseburia sp.]